MIHESKAIKKYCFLISFFCGFIFLTSCVSKNSIPAEIKTNVCPLSPGPGIDIVALSGAVDPMVLAAFEQVLKNNCFKVEVPSYFNKEESLFSYYANTDAIRFQQFTDVAENTHKIVWAARGGYGAQAVIRDIFKNYVKSSKTHKIQRKVLIGYSDITVPGLFMHHHFDWFFIHGLMYASKDTAHAAAQSMSNKETSLMPLLDILKGHTDSISYTLTPLNDAAKKLIGSLHGEILGGNFTVLHNNLNGLLKDIQWEGKILFLEDWNELLLQMRDKIQGLFDTGAFDRVTAIVLGDFKFKGDSDEFQKFATLLAAHIRDYMPREIPLFYIPEFGHGDINNPLPMGLPAEINPAGTLIIDLHKLVDFVTS